MSMKSKVISVSVYSDNGPVHTKVKVQRPNREALTTTAVVTHNVSKGKVLQIVHNSLGIPPNELEVPDYINRSLPIQVV